MESMTGYAFLEKSTEQFSFSVEIKSLNSKYLEVFVNLPKILRNDENEIIKLVKSRISRGKIELTIDIYDWNNSRPLSLNRDMIGKYYAEITGIQKELGIVNSVSMDSILGLEGITTRERSALSKRSRKDIDQTIETVISRTIEMRKKEGAVTKKDIISALTDISGDTAKIKGLSKKVYLEKRENLRGRLESILKGVGDNTRIYSEIALLTDKLDINEELVRLGDHLKKFKVLLKESGQIGRKLDFLAQELFREINTIASKSSSSEISHLVVNVKNNIDKIREQCRNIV